MAVVTRLCVEVRAEEILRELATRQKFGVEIGVYRGSLSELLLLGDQTLRLYMIDPWRQMDTPSYLETDDKHHRMTQSEHDACMAIAAKRTERFGKRAKLVRCTSLEAAPAFKDGMLDFVFIDGDHSYESVRADLAAWWPKVMSGGIFSGHDYREERGYGVKQAVDEFAAAHGRSLRLGHNYCWFMTR